MIHTFGLGLQYTGAIKFQMLDKEDSYAHGHATTGYE
jgi:hypothetical protein